MSRFTVTIADDGASVATALGPDGTMHSVTHEHPNFKAIVNAIVNHEDPTPLMDLRGSILALDDRVSIEGDVLHFDGQPVHNSLARTILRYNQEGRDTANLVKFMELLNENPSYRARNQLFDWTESQNLTIDEDGYIVGYKGVAHDGDGGYKSVTAGRALVDGVEYVGQIPNPIGSTISMPRPEVDDDPTVDCSSGLHIGSYSYASWFGSILLEVRFSPADVVSVPTHDTNKLRCCQYQPLAVHVAETRDWNTNYEPEATAEDEDFSPEVEELMENEHIPSHFLASLRDRVKSWNVWGDRG